MASILLYFCHSPILQHFLGTSEFRVLSFLTVFYVFFSFFKCIMVTKQHKIYPLNFLSVHYCWQFVWCCTANLEFSHFAWLKLYARWLGTYYFPLSQPLATNISLSDSMIWLFYIFYIVESFSIWLSVIDLFHVA